MDYAVVYNWNQIYSKLLHKCANSFCLERNCTISAKSMKTFSFIELEGVLVSCIHFFMFFILTFDHEHALIIFTMSFNLSCIKENSLSSGIFVIIVEIKSSFPVCTLFNRKCVK